MRFALDYRLAGRVVASVVVRRVKVARAKHGGPFLGAIFPRYPFRSYRLDRHLSPKN